MSSRRRGNGSRAASRSLVRRANRGVNSSAAVASLCSVTDPFCHHANGAQWNSLDSADLPTIPYTWRGILTVSTGDTGYAVIVCTPDCAQQVLGTKAINTSLTYTAPAMGSFDNNMGPSFDTTDNGAIATVARVVSAGVRIFDASPATAGGGFIRMYDLNWADLEADSVLVTDDFPTFPQFIGDRRNPHGHAWVSRRVTSEANDFREGTTNGKTTMEDAAAGGSGWSNLYAVISGDASTKVLTVECVVHYEIVPSAGITFGVGHSMGRVPRPIASAALNVFHQAGSNILGNAGDRVSETLKRMAVQALSYGASLVGGPIAGLLTNGAGNLMIADAPRNYRRSGFIREVD